MMKYTELGNTAVKIEPEYQPQYEPEYEPQEQVKKAPRRRLSTKDVPFGLKVKMILRVLFVTALALLMIARFAAVSQANIGLVAARSEVKKQQSVNSDLDSKLSASMQLDTVQQKAISMGMSFPGSDQIVRVKLVPYEDLVKQNNSSAWKESKGVISQIID